MCDKINQILNLMERMDKSFAHKINEDVKSDLKSIAKDMETKPTEAQIEAGNYKKGHINILGFKITIENPKGSIRSGVDEKGNEWETKMNNHYGYFSTTEGKDGDHIDVFIGDDFNVDTIYVVDQFNKSQFDEHKCMLGFKSIDEAEKAYLSNYSKGWEGLKNITEVSIDTFKEWLYSGSKKIKPFKDYKNFNI